MSVTAEEVEAARRKAEEARKLSEETHKAADKAEADAKKAQKKAEDSRKTATDLDKKAGDMDREASTLEGKAKASSQQCTAARDSAARAESRAVGEKTRADRIHELYPDVCNEETAAADQRAETARKQADAAAASAKTKCEQAAKDQKAAEEARKKAADADKKAKEAEAAAVKDEAAAKTAQNLATTQRANAVAAALDASLADTRARAMATEFENGQICIAPTPRDPFTDDVTPVVGAPPAPRDQGGCQSDTTANFTIGAKMGIIFYGGDSFEKVEGKLVEVTVGQKITNTFIFDSSVVIGGKVEEVVGLDSKLMLGGDYRTIHGARWERNVLIKAESVLGDSTETVLAGQEQHVPTINGGSNPTNRIETCPDVESKAGQIIENHKGALKELRKTVRENLTSSKEYYHSLSSNITNYTDEVGKIRHEIAQLTAKLDDFKTQAKKYEMKSSGLIKFMAQGTIKLKAGRFKGSAKAKYHICCDAIAQLQGEVKWN